MTTGPFILLSSTDWLARHDFCSPGRDHEFGDTTQSRAYALATPGKSVIWPPVRNAFVLERLIMTELVEGK